MGSSIKKSKSRSQRLKSLPFKLFLILSPLTSPKLEFGERGVRDYRAESTSSRMLLSCREKCSGSPSKFKRSEGEVDLFLPPSQLVVLQLCQVPGGEGAQSDWNLNELSKFLEKKKKNWTRHHSAISTYYIPIMFFLSLESMLSEGRYQVFHHDVLNVWYRVFFLVWDASVVSVNWLNEWKFPGGIHTNVNYWLLVSLFVSISI